MLNFVVLAGMCLWRYSFFNKYANSYFISLKRPRDEKHTSPESKLRDCISNKIVELLASKASESLFVLDARGLPLQSGAKVKVNSDVLSNMIQLTSFFFLQPNQTKAIFKTKHMSLARQFHSFVVLFKKYV